VAPNEACPSSYWPKSHKTGRQFIGGLRSARS
jgi:hypothetical protein